MNFSRIETERFQVEQAEKGKTPAPRRASLTLVAMAAADPQLQPSSSRLAGGRRRRRRRCLAHKRDARYVT